MQLAGDVFGEDLKKILPIIREDGSDSQKFDNCLEFLVIWTKLSTSYDDDGSRTMGTSQKYARLQT